MTIELPIKLKQRMAKGKFVIVGRAGMDLYPKPANKQTSEAGTFISDLGGSAANIAVSISKLGGRSQIITVVSDDEIGDFVWKKLEEHEVDTSLVTKSQNNSARTSLAIAEIKEVPKVVIYRNNAADLLIDKQNIDSLNLENYAGIVITGTALSDEPSRSTINLLIEKSKNAKCPVIFDVDYRANAWTSISLASAELRGVAKIADMCVGNREEFEIMFEQTDLRKVSANFNPNQLVLFKKGADGCDIILDGETESYTVFKVKAKKPYGAGDAFLGTILHSLSNGLSLESAIKRGNASAAIVVSKEGCSSAMPNLNQLIEFIETH